MALHLKPLVLFQGSSGAPTLNSLVQRNCSGRLQAALVSRSSSSACRACQPAHKRRWLASRAHSTRKRENGVGVRPCSQLRAMSDHDDQRRGHETSRERRALLKSANDLGNGVAPEPHDTAKRNQSRERSKVRSLLLYLSFSTTFILGLIPLSLYLGPPLTGLGFADSKWFYLDSAPTIAFLVGYVGFMFLDRSLTRSLLFVLGISAVLSTITLKVDELKLLKADNETAFLVFTVPLVSFFTIRYLIERSEQQREPSKEAPPATAETDQTTETRGRTGK
jgi:hypothetical protein